MKDLDHHMFMRGELLRTSTAYLRDRGNNPVLFAPCLLHALISPCFLAALSIRRQRAPRRCVDQLIGSPSFFNVASLELNPPFPMPSYDFLIALRGELTSFAQEEHFDLLQCSVQLFHQLRVGAEDSPDGSLTYHAHPNIEGHPWYDDVLLLEEAQPRLKYTLARLVAFVFVRVPVEAFGVADKQAPQEFMLAFTHAFCAPGTKGRITDLYSPQCRVAAYAAPVASRAGRIPSRVTLPRFPMMQLAFLASNKPVVRLVDTLSISSAVWTTPNLDRCDLYWVFREAGKGETHDEEEASNDMSSVEDLDSDGEPEDSSAEEDEQEQ